MFTEPHFSSTNHPGISAETLDQFWANLLRLSLTAPLFPHPQDLLSAACKVQRDSDLSIVAATVTRSPYPRSAVLSNGDDLSKACSNRGLVIKRDFSDSTTCTFLPGSARRQKVMDAQRQTLALYQGIEAIPRPSWMAQPFNKDLSHKGELRAFVVGGVLQHTIHTWPAEGGDGFCHEYVDNYTPLGLLQ